MIRTLSLLAALAAIPAAANATTVTAEVTYRERIALPSDALLVVELRDAMGRIVARQAVPTEGAQVPLTIRVEAPDAAEGLVLQAGILGPGAPWLTEATLVPGDGGAADAGTLMARRTAMVGPSHAWRCGEDLYWLGWTEEGARLRRGGSWVDLAPERTASGFKVAAPQDPTTFAWSKGRRMTISWHGTEAECLPALAPLAAGFSARGNEPGWRLDVHGGRFVFGQLDGPGIEAMLSQPERTAEGLRYSAPEAGLTVTLADRLTHGTMADLPYPVAVTVETPDRVFSGTGGDPGALIEGLDWRLAEIAGLELPADLDAWLRFEGRAVWGRGGCNRFTGGFELGGELFTIGPVAATMMACPGALMAAERGLFAALEATRTFDIEADGTLVLIGPAGPVARLVP